MKDLMKSISYAIMFDRMKEFKIIINQSSELVQNIKDKNSNTLIHIIVSREKANYLETLKEIIQIQNKKKTEEERNLIFTNWINRKNIKGKSALHFATQKNDLVI